MYPLDPPRTIKVYQLLKQTGLYFSSAGTSSNTSVGLGFYLTREEAEHQRTLETLKTHNSDDQYHIFELDIPNPAYRDIDR